jgi:dihydroorotase
VNPPLAEEEDRLALVEGLVDGTIDAIATDHAPHAAADKAAGAPGYSGLETAFSLVYETLSRDGRLGLRDLSRLMSAAPARILGLEDRGLLEVGMRADLVLVNTGATLAVEPSTWKSRGKNSPIAGRRLPGAVLITLHGGRIVHDAR